MNRLIINPRADADIDAEALFITEQFGAQRGDRFYDACETAFNNLLNYPQIGRVRQFVNIPAELRQWQVKGFSDYLIFYRLLNDNLSLTIEVLRVIHGARDLVALFQDEFDRGTERAIVIQVALRDVVFHTIQRRSVAEW